MNRIEGYLLSVRTVTRVKIAAPMSAAILFRNVERPDRLRYSVRKAHENPRTLEVFRPIHLSTHELSVRGIKAVPIPVKGAAADTANLFLFAHGKLHRASVKARTRLTLLTVPYGGDEQLVASIRSPIEMATHPAILETTAQFRPVVVDRQTGRLPD